MTRSPTPPRESRTQLLQTVLEGSRQMLALARRGEWDALVECETRRRVAVAAFKACHEGLKSPLSPAEDALRQEILNLDNTTRGLAETWMAETAQQLTSFNTSRKLRSAYFGLG